MEGVPEGVGRGRRRRPRASMIAALAIVAAYLIFRLVQGVMWLAGHL